MTQTIEKETTQSLLADERILESLQDAIAEQAKEAAATRASIEALTRSMSLVVDRMAGQRAVNDTGCRVSNPDSEKSRRVSYPNTLDQSYAGALMLFLDKLPWHIALYLTLYLAYLLIVQAIHRW